MIEERRDARLTLTVGLRVMQDQHGEPPRLLRARRERPRHHRAASSVMNARRFN
jgi:hypothetical protein